jgi:hypothetical protein
MCKIRFNDGEIVALKVIENEVNYDFQFDDAKDEWTHEVIRQQKFDDLLLDMITKDY